MKNKPFIILLIIANCIFFSACNNTTTQQLTSDDLIQFCLDFEAAVNQGNATYINSLFDDEYVINVATNGIDAPEEYQDGFINGFKQAYNIGDVIVSSIGNEGYYKFMRVLESEDTIKALYRVVAESGLNYQEIDFVVNDNSEIKLVDFYSYLDGDIFSKSIRRLYILNLANEVETFTHPFAEHLPAVNEIAMLADRQDYETAYEKCQQLPPVMQDEKIVQIIKLQIANSIDKQTFEKEKQQFINSYPNDNMIYLKSMELAFERQNIDEIVAAIDVLNKKIGGDPYLKLIKAGVYRSNVQDDLALQLAEEALAEEPDNDEAYWMVLDMLIVKKDYEKAIDYFYKIQEQFGENAAEYIMFDGYEDFYNSEPYKQWITEFPPSESLTPLPDSILLEDELDILH